MSGTRHIADAEEEFKVVNITPDFCLVAGVVVPFEIYRDLSPARIDHAKKVRARGAPLITIKSAVRGVMGNAGAGVLSKVSLAAGEVVVLEGVKTVHAEKAPIVRDQALCLMNVKRG